MAGGRRKIRFSKLYSFSCMKCSLREEHSQIGKRGFSRIVYCNDPDNPEQVQLKYRGNYVSTTKYTAINFIPKSLFEQFRRVANIYFLVVACVSFSPLAPYTASSILAPLLVVIGATMAKEGIEDWRRKRQDIEANNRKVNVYTENHTFQETRWRSLRVGDLIKVHKDEYFPADLLLLSSSYEDGICYVETSNLDGETNLKSIFINQDREMYYEETDKPAHARTSNLNEELGQVDTILSDKTGTLTCNSMEFVKCSIAGVAYGRVVTEIERALAKRKRDGAVQEVGDASNDVEESNDTAVNLEISIKGFNFKDERIMNGQWVHEPHQDMIQKFFRVLAICHTVIPDVNKKTGEISYEAESPDEAAFVIAARELGFQFFERTQSRITLHELDHRSGKVVDRSYQLLHVLEFSSSRKRMSVIVKNAENQLLLLCKGADSVMFERLSKDGRAFEGITREHLRQYAEAGLRTLIVAYRELDEEEFQSWEQEFLNAQASVTADRDALVDAAADKIEKDLILLGVTAVEDKLQKGVPECIDKLAKAGIKIWVLTGDKMETAINIGYACSLLRPDMRQIIITLDSQDILDLENQGNKETVAKVSHDSITKQIREGISQISSSKEITASFGLIIDGKSLSFALDKKLEKSFLELAISCASVICCRSTPKQKALVTRLVKVGTHQNTLAIGDGANDVSMLQEADVGVGISGVEGMQAVMSSDYAIAQFRFLERLLLVHGHWCYRRISMMLCYFFYKNLAFGLTLFWFEGFASFSGRPAYNDWYMSLYNVFFTSLPVIALGVFDQDVSARLCLEFPKLYEEGTKNILFSWPRILGWMLNGVICSMIIFFGTNNSIVHHVFRKDGQPVDYGVFGVIMYTCVVWTVNCQMAVSINYFTWIQHFFIWGSIAIWYVFLAVYGSLSPIISTTAYQILVEACAPSPFYWLVTLLVVVSSLLPYVTYRAFQTEFRPMYHDQIQRIRFEGLNSDFTEEFNGRGKEKI
ncbi:putative phospholipid-transporting ATPase 8 isoform X2 [Nicotiana tabacum]|uniref:Phospholipid-transporting ATPase n=1 Tax=Nicotiana tabacum TaxID=4097 RepID=A0A1S4AQJ4_TOBAC